MNWTLNPVFLGVVGAVIASLICYVYLKKTKTDEDEEVDNSPCWKVGLLNFIVSLLISGYVSYTHGQAETEALTAEFFQTGQPQF